MNAQPVATRTPSNTKVMVNPQTAHVAIWSGIWSVPALRSLGRSPPVGIHS